MPVSAASRARRQRTGVSANDDLPGVRQLDAGKELQQRRLAGAVLADDAHDFAGAHLERDVVQDLGIAATKRLRRPSARIATRSFDDPQPVAQVHPREERGDEHDRAFDGLLQEGAASTYTRPLAMTASTSTPIADPSTLPDPPRSEVPPMTMAVIAPSI